MIIENKNDITSDLDCSTNPSYPPSSINNQYRVSGAGKIGGASGIDVSVGDIIKCISTNSGGTQVASSFIIVQGNIEKASQASINAGVEDNTFVTPLKLKTWYEFVNEADRLLIVKPVGQAGAQFNSVKAAIDSIITNSASNRFVVLIYPGIYIEDTITLKSYVDLVSFSNNSVIIEVNDVNKDCIILAPNAMLSDVIVRGSTGVGSAIFKINASFAPGETCLLRNVTYGNTNTVFKSALGIGGFAIAVFQNVTKLFNSTFTTGFDISGSGTTLVSIQDTKMAVNNAATDFIHIRGAGNRIIMTDVGILVNQPLGGSMANFVRMYDGAVLDVVSVAIDGCVNAINNENTGARCILRLNNFNAINSTTYDVKIDHPSTSGNLSGTLTKEKVIIEATNTVFSLSYAEPTGGFVVTGPFNLGDVNSSLVKTNLLVQHTPTVGRLNGGLITLVVGLNIAISSGNGYIHNSAENIVFVTWAAASLAIPANSLRYITVDSSGTIVLQSSLPDNKTSIILGKVISNETTIVSINNTSLNAHHYSNELDNYLRDVVKAIYVSGSLISENVISFKLNISSGIYYFTNKKITPSGGLASQFTTVYRSATSGQHIYTSGIDLVPTNFYDNGTGTLAAVPAGKFTKHLLYCNGSGADEKYFLVYAQQIYNTELEATNGEIPAPPSGFIESIVKISSIVVQQAGTVISKIIDERPLFNKGAASASTGVSAHGNLSGLLNDDHPQYARTDGTRVYTGNQNFGGFQITNIGNINGVSLTDHFSRHLPNGADPLTTAIPVTIGTSNTIGIANSLARSDHQHSHGNQAGGALHSLATTLLDGFLSSVDKVYINGLPTELNAKENTANKAIDFITVNDIKYPTVKAVNDQLTLKQNSLGFTPENVVNKGAINGYAALDANSRVPMVQLPTFNRSISIPDTSSSENISLWFTDKAITISKISSILRGSASPSVTFTVRYGTDRSAVGTLVNTLGITVTSTTIGQVTTIFDNASIPANNFIWLTTSAKAGVVNELGVTVIFN